MTKINYKYEILKKIKNKSAKIAVLGLGYVGLPLSLMIVKNKYLVKGFDTDKKKINLIKSSKSYINQITRSSILKAKKEGFTASSNFKDLVNFDVIIITVPTPLKNTNTPDLSFIRNCISGIKPYLKKGQLIILESTSYPGTTEEEIINKIEKKFLIGENFFVVYSPERIDPGRNDNAIDKIPKLISGKTKNCLKVGFSFYKSLFKKLFKVSDLKTAEFTKILENIFRAVNIGFINEMKIISKAMNIDIYEVIKAARTKPYGFRAYEPGPGIGGHCLPVDPIYLHWKAKKFNVEAKFVKLSTEINKDTTNYVKKNIFKFLNGLKKKINKTKVLVLGVSYKKNIEDTRESPAINIIENLLYKNVSVQYADPYVKEIKKIKYLKKKLKSTKINKKNLMLFDLVILTTDHDNFNYDFIYKNSKKILDCRGKFKNSFKVIRA